MRFHINSILLYNKANSYFSYIIFRKSDILIGSLDENLITKQYFFASRPYYRDELTWCVQQRQPIPKWKNFLRLCLDPSVHAIGFFLSFLTLIVCLYMDQFESTQPKWDWHKHFLSCFCICLGSFPQRKPKIFATRIHFASLLFGGMILSNTVFSFMLVMLKAPMFDPQLDSIHEILEDDAFKLVGDNFALQQLIRKSGVCFMVDSKKSRQI